MTDQTEKIFVKESRFLDHVATFRGKFSEIRCVLDKLEREGWEGIDILNYGDHYLYKHRLETNKEQDKRLAAFIRKLAKEAADKEKRRTQYETLRKEFGD